MYFYMKIKEDIKKILFLLRYIFCKKNRIVVNKEYCFDVIKDKNNSVFFGYYDLNPIKNDKYLLHILDRNAIVGKDTIQIAYYDLNTKIINKIGASKAWSYQQGSRLRWGNNCIYYNDFDGEKYVTRKFNVEKNKLIETFSIPLYDISKNEEFGISVNFERLQYLRPGYGYHNHKNYSLESDDLKNDGLIYFDLDSCASKILISLHELSDGIVYDTYINHVSISPDSTKIMYFLLWNENKKRKSKLFVYDLVNCENILIDSDVLVSHYVWKDNKSLVITCVNNGITEYRVYDIESKTHKTIKNKTLNTDGHPTFISKDEFISDTYPILGIQKLFSYNFTEDKINVIAKLYSHPFLTGEKRCDLHPKVSEHLISVDSTCFGKYRNIVIFKRK